MKIAIFTLLSTLAFLSSCSVNRYIPKNETLYTGATFDISTEVKTKNLKDIKEELQNVLTPQPNSTKLGLYAHYKVTKDSAGFIYKFINKKSGETPVYQSEVAIKKTKELVDNRLENLGFYHNKISAEIKENNKKSTVNYSVELKKPYVMETYQLDSDTLPIYKEIQKTLSESLLEKGERFNLSKLKLERERIDKKLKTNGYYNFNADFLVFELDTNQYKTKRFDLYLRLKKDVPKKALFPYALKNVNVYTKYSLRNKDKQKDTIALKGVNFIQDSLFFLPKKLRPFLLLKKGKLYNPTKFKITSKRLSSISTYKFVNVEFDEYEITNDSLAFLDTNIYLSPLRKRSLSAELQANTKSSGFTGPALALSYNNRNLFKGGEYLKLTSKFGYEIQTGNTIDTSAGLNSVELGLTGELVFPKLLFPMNLSDQFKYGVPSTKISTGIEYLSRSELYSLGSFNTSFGYQWNANKYVYHKVNPISTSFVKLYNTTDEFQEILDENEFLENSFEQQLISGLTYNFTYTELSDATKKRPLYFSSNIELVGNSLSLLTSQTNEDNKKTILGVEYAQYAKIDVDGRFYFKLDNEKTIVTRLYGGLGYTYGNSDVLPFSRQFFSGGPYSIRAFSTRSIGPGTYDSDDDTSDTYFDSSGDIKLEANIEYRFPLYSFIKGAFFMDAGNVWLLRENDEFPGGQFSSDFSNELAIGGGFGIRLDIQSFVIRLDWAVPMHSPTDSSKNYMFDASNGIFNFAIGYPF